ncbi:MULTISPECIES: MMPL family transporter [Shouchella]|uniref:MMPL family transporter n=2 Tax=Shouchella TaxID=2893057 RepID=A0ABY7WA46_9BACI|nr:MULTISPECIES: MMPL family transporter [Shouchella]MED4128752.1 MMPL family transporter [Shouchella miscanthi]WDF05780.1 MMPL family transporter [Shouchella hunanensis]
MERGLKRIGKWMATYRWGVVGVWIVLIVFGGYYATQVGGYLTGGGWGVPGSGSNQAYELVSEEFESRNATSLTFVMSHDTYEVGSTEFTEALEQASASLSDEDEIESVYTWVNAEERIKDQFVSDQRHTSIGFVEMNVDEGFAQKVLPDIQERLTEAIDQDGFQATVLGAPAFWGEMNQLSQEGLEKAHLYALPIIIIVLLFVFRSVVSSLTPLLLSGFSIIASLGVLYFFAQGIELSIFVLDAALMLGIGVGIDFALIFVKRYREQLEKTSGNHLDAVAETMGTAGHAILFSALTIIGSMSAILFVDIAAVRSIALGVIVVVFFLMLTSLSLLPAFLAIVGPKINALRVPFMSLRTVPNQQGTWYKLAHKVMKRPILYFAGSVFFLLLLAWPALELEVSTPDSRMLPEDTQVRSGISDLEDGFGVGYSAPIQVVVSTEEGELTDEASLTNLQSLQEELEGIANVEEVNSLFSFFPDMTMDSISDILTDNQDLLSAGEWMMLNRNLGEEKNVVIFDVISNDYSSSEANRGIVKEIRSNHSSKDGWTVLVGGETAEGLDTSQSLNDSLLGVLAFTLALLFIVLVITFKSVLLPLKAIIMNILSLGATYGVLVAVFQWGWGSEIFGFGEFGFIQSFIPILLLGLLFSLSTDYEVFLLSRVQEEYMKGVSNEESVALGLEKTAPMISGAALIMVAVFGSFAFAGVLPMQQLGFGMALAIALDATVVRLFLVPATMKLLGDWNWWLPFKRSSRKTNLEKQRSIS